MSLPRTEKVRMALLFMEEVLPDIEDMIDMRVIAQLRGGADPENIKATYVGLDAVKTALRQFTTPDRLTDNT